MQFEILVKCLLEDWRDFLHLFDVIFIDVSDSGKKSLSDGCERLLEAIIFEVDWKIQSQWNFWVDVATIEVF